MNNKNKILVGCLALLLVLSVGYALFRETVTINGTAKAKGDFDITVTALTDNEIDTEGLGTPNKGMITASSVDIADNVVTTNVALGMPGSEKMFIIKVENTGTIPAVLKSVTDENDNPYEGGTTGFFAGKTVQNTAKTSTINVEMGPDMNYIDDYTEKPYGPDYTSTIDDVSSAVLEPGEFTYYYLDYLWLGNSTSGEQMSLSWIIKLNWEQLAN